MSTVDFDAPETINEENVALLDPEETNDGPGETNGTPDDTSGSENETTDDKAEAVSDQPETVQTAPSNVNSVSPPHQASDESSNRTEADDMLDQIRNAERECRQKEAHVELLKEGIKEAKAQYEQAVIKLRELCSESSASRSTSTPKQTQKSPPTQANTQSVMGESIVGMPPPAADQSGTSPPPEKPDESWREVPLSELLAEPIKGIGPKKKNALFALCPTLGAFQDLRARVGKDAASFHELLPDRMGPEAASELEERFLNWLASRYDKAPKDEKSQILNRAKEINTGTNNCLDTKHPDGKQWYESGWQAYSREVKLEECPYLPGPEQDDWIRGWLGHELIERYEKSGGNEGDQSEASVASHGETQSEEPSEPPATVKFPTLLDQAVSLSDL